MNEIPPIAMQNSSRLAQISTVFCQMNGIRVTSEIADAMADAVVCAINEWYNDNEGRCINLVTEVVCEDAIVYAFKQMQGIFSLARVAVSLGMTSADLPE